MQLFSATQVNIFSFLLPLGRAKWTLLLFRVGRSICCFFRYFKLCGSYRHIISQYCCSEFDTGTWRQKFHHQVHGIFLGGARLTEGNALNSILICGQFDNTERGHRGASNLQILIYLAELCLQSFHVTLFLYSILTLITTNLLTFSVIRGQIKLLYFYRIFSFCLNIYFSTELFFTRLKL